MNEERILFELQERETSTRRVFHVAKKNAGFLGLGVGIQVLVDGEITDEAIVYGDTLYAIGRHVDAQVSGDLDRMTKTNKNLPKRFQYPQETAAELR